MAYRLRKTSHSSSTILIRLLVAVIFLCHGIQKFIFPLKQGEGYFKDIGIPYPVFSAYTVGVFEIICALLILIGFYTRLAALPLIVIMVVAISVTKIDFLISGGFWHMINASYLDWSMLTCSIYLFIEGGGYYSLDLKQMKKKHV